VHALTADVIGRSALLEQGVEGLDGGEDACDVDVAHLIQLLRVSARTRVSVRNSKSVRDGVVLRIRSGLGGRGLHESAAGSSADDRPG
jgi:hypothetical protein